MDDAACWRCIERCRGYSTSLRRGRAPGIPRLGNNIMRLMIGAGNRGWSLRYSAATMISGSPGTPSAEIPNSVATIARAASIVRADDRANSTVR